MLELRSRQRVKGSDSIEGEVIHRRMSDDGEKVEYLIQWDAEDEDGDSISHERYFEEHELVQTADAPPKEKLPAKEAPKGTSRQRVNKSKRTRK